jgi:hypothetical protein
MSVPELPDDAQVFRPTANAAARVGLLALALMIAGTIGLAAMIYESGAVQGHGIPVPQPVQFSHRHHVGQLGIHCLYCHTSVEASPYGGIPPTHTCMSCHSQVWTNSPLLEPVRESYVNDTPILWQKVHDLPDFVYFNHSIHVAKGVGCATCHGPVERMQQVYMQQALNMGWCLGCHREPERYVRPLTEIYNQGWQLPEAEQLALGRELVQEYGIRVGYLTECYVCHR